MYQLAIDKFGAFSRYTLEHAATGNKFEIVPEKGANLLQLAFQGKPVLDGYSTPEELDLAKWGKSAVLFPFPNRLDRGVYEWQGKSYQFPLNNAATENAIHGFVRTEAFYVVKIELAQTYATLECRFDYDGSREYYPFPFSLHLQFRIQDNQQFTVQASCTNHHTGPIPVGFGWHPYFKLDEKADQHSLRLPNCSLVHITDRMIPTGARELYTAFARKKQLADAFLDNCFFAEKDGNYKMELSGSLGTLQVSASAAQFPFFQVFTPPHRESIALEPMSCNVDAFNNGDGLYILHPNAIWKGNIIIKFK